MRLDSNSRFIAGFCGAAVIVLVTWLHVNGETFNPRTVRCDGGVTPPSETQDCTRCRLDGAVSLETDDAPRSRVRIAGTAPRF